MISTGPPGRPRPSERDERAAPAPTDRAAARDGVLLLHGIAPLAWSMRRMERALRGAGYDTFECRYPSRRHDLRDLAAYVAERTASWRASLDGQLHLVTHSMGGLVARVLAAHHDGFAPPRLGRTVQIAPPNGGSEIADALMCWAPYRLFYGPAGAQLGTAGWSQGSIDGPVLWPAGCPLAIIAGSRSLDPLGWLLLPKPNDGRVTVASTRLPGAAHLALPATHTLIASNPAAIAATLRFLRGEAPWRAGPFTRPGEGPTCRGTGG